MTRMHNRHQYNYSPADEATNAKRIARKDVFCVAATLAIFAVIGLLLAWRG